MKIDLMPHQVDVLNKTAGMNRVAYYLDMGLGKTFVGAEKAMSLNKDILIVCQKSKIDDWKEHFFKHYIDKTKCDESGAWCYDLTSNTEMDMFFHSRYRIRIGVINYELAFRRPDLLKLKNFTLMLDESSLISNEKAKRSKFVLKLKPDNVILLSGTPTAGKYERLWSQCQLLGWTISKSAFWGSYICSEWKDFGGFLHQVVTGYKNVNHLKKKLSEHGAVFMKTQEVMTLPEQVDQMIYVPASKPYRQFMKNPYLILPDGTELAGTNPLTKMLYARRLCGELSIEKLDAYDDLLSSTDDNLVVFYNFHNELALLVAIAEKHGRSYGIINGDRKDSPEGHDILFVQYQAGAYGLNLQGFANKIVYFTLPLGKGSCDLWEQSKKRIHRIGQTQTCFYYYMLVRDSIETRNLAALKEGKELTDDLFRKGGDR